MAVSASGYYDWQGRLGELAKRGVDKKLLKEQVKAFHCSSRKTYGYRRVHADLVSSGHRVSKKQVAKVMQEEGLQGLCKGRFKPVTTNSNHSRPVADNHLEQDFRAAGPHQKWVADFTYIRTAEGWLYLAVVLDLFSRKVIGWAFSDRMTEQLCLGALQMALLYRQADLRGTTSAQQGTATTGTHAPAAGTLPLMHHSDRGSQYASVGYQDLLHKNQVLQSMSRKGNCYDNAVVESFFATLKAEEANRNTYLTRQQATSSIFAYIEGFYNKSRRHSALGFLSPLDFEAQYWHNQTQVA
jgi:putative transposase